MNRGDIYAAISYAAPFVFFFVILAFLKLIREEARYFLFQQVTGTRDARSKPERAANETHDRTKKIETYLYVEFEDDINSTIFTSGWNYFLTSSVLAMLLTIVFEGCVLITVGVIIGDACPDFPVECFGPNLSFYCNPGDVANSSVATQTAWCFGWIWKYQTAHNVIDTIGVSGGLLGIISCIVPLVYHISAYEEQPFKAFIWIWLPFLPLLALFIIEYCISPLTISILTRTCLVGSFILSFGAWSWAFLSKYKKKYGCCQSECYWPTRITPQAMNEH